MKGIKEGDEISFSLLIKKYEKCAWSLARQIEAEYDYLEIPVEDYMSLAFSAVITALEKYQEQDTLSFYPYWLTIARNAIMRHIKSSLTNSKLLTTVAKISLDQNIEGSNTSLHDVVSDNETIQTMTIHDSLLNIVNNDKNKFSKTERLIISLYLDGYSLKEIGKMLNFSYSYVYSKYNSIIKKLREILNERK